MKDKIFKTFIGHTVIKDIYKLKKSELPTTVAQGLDSDVPIIRAIATIVERKENVSKSYTDDAIFKEVANLLNTML